MGEEEIKAEEVEKGENEPEEEAAEETEESPEVTQPATLPSPVATAKANELKIVILVNGDSVMLGVAKPDCDPIFKNLTGDLTVALQQVPAFVEEAGQKWAMSPRYPKAPEPPPVPVASGATPARTPAPAKPKAQPSFF